MLLFFYVCDSFFFFFKQKTAYEMRISDWSSDVCSSDLDRGLVKAPLFVQTCFGILGGIGSHPDDIMHMKRTADRLFGDQYEWSVLGAGARQMSIVAMAASMGGNVRVGLEDSLWGGPGKLAESNEAQVRNARTIVEG